jgi:uncharacterized membrane protein
MKWKNIFYNVTLAANCLLCFLLIFYEKLIAPSLLQVFGRMHPLFLHFPIVLFALFIAWIWFAPKNKFNNDALFQNIGEWLLLATAFTAAFTALMGLFLSREQGYNQDALTWHKWSGALVSIITFLWYSFYDKLQKTKSLLLSGTLLSSAAMIIAGHQGADITHGDNFLLAPVEKNKIKKVSLDEALVFNDMVQPILKEKCMSCHNSKKAKGELIMETEQTLKKGGKDGALWDTADANSSLILKRIHLPLEEKKHMSPNGKPQLTEEEIAVLYGWIKDGANFKKKVTELAPADTLRVIAENIFKSSDEEEYDFGAASESTIKKLNSNFRAVYPIAKNSPAIAVDFYGASFFKPEQLKDLLEIKTQLVSLNLDKIPITDNDLQTIGQLTNLRNLNLSFTKITGSGLAALNKLNHLKSISLTNTAISKESVQQIASLKEIKNIYVWNTGITVANAAELNKKYPAVEIQTGARTDTMLLKINPPVVQNTTPVIVDTPIQLKLKHFVPGANIRYTLDGSDPDSGQSLAYDNKTFIKEAGLMKARAYKKGWSVSDLVQYRFYRATYKADTVIMMQLPEERYKGKGGKVLNDFDKGSLNGGDGKWLGFRKNNMECMMVFQKPVNIQHITFNSLVDVGSKIFPPKNIKIYGGMSANDLKLLSQLNPAIDTLRSSDYIIPYEFKIHSTDVKYIKVVAETIGQLPRQFIQPKNPKDKKPHKPEDDKGWLFVDEIFLN